MHINRSLVTVVSHVHSRVSNTLVCVKSPEVCVWVYVCLCVSVRLRVQWLKSSETLRKAILD